MNWDETFRLIFAALASVGGAGAIIVGFSKYLGELFSKKYEQKLIAKFQNQINEYQNKLDILKTTTLRYSDRQFELYSILWSSLQNLKISADNLWEKANSKNLVNFSKQLRETKIEIEKASLFIEDVHYKELAGIIKHFSEFEIGKKMLIDYRKTTQLEEHLIERQMIAGNQRVKNRYNELILIIKSDLKKQLKGE
ncbi:hypothetical protein [Salegentibacter salarius]|uniref:Uncharacterized protein n=1 Tax=Salegentibacter salarius TaxID=435906 RepID=A0A2N0TRA0_9FLAO|nr:hypothetical protein [Salegentibacter salarius]OEY71913.1 hypothetical protein BHS39_14950 [Salegentibacter salarius]PKD17261.1 hypothetical protein APR40_14920 [Salegentibacter salarius]SLK06117.1 hypothetical protein SAMN05660445_03074 [Salegentibacter salarius]